MVDMENRTIGEVKVQLYAGLPGSEPIEVGLLTMPMTLNTIRSGKTFEVRLSEACEYAATMVQAIFGGKVQPPEDQARAWAQYRQDHGVPPERVGAAHQAFLAGWDAAQGAQRWRLSPGAHLSVTSTRAISLTSTTTVTQPRSSQGKSLQRSPHG